MQFYFKNKNSLKILLKKIMLNTKFNYTPCLSKNFEWQIFCLLNCLSLHTLETDSLLDIKLVRKIKIWKANFFSITGCLVQFN